MHEALLETLYEDFQLGKQTDGGAFKADEWALALEAESSCRNKWTWFKEAWKNWKILAGMSGFGWDEQEELFKADKSVWNGLAKVTYKNIRWHKNNVLHFRNILGEVLDGAQATGQGALSPIRKLVLPFNVQTSSRSQSDRNESDNEDNIKRPRTMKKIDIGQAVASMVDELRRSREAKQDKTTIQETAIDVLYRDYEAGLGIDAFVDAINVLESESKARIFTRLNADEKRDRWLEVAIGTELLPQQEEEVSLDSLA
ncbi:uncharacterized protein V1513DRAFT_465931 [Lipomyces chichibuensis]|uniref:uncharacterized protein n=1 Tax=Lipomyces chichibuensis TaxID=1546026 RepID=UPI003344079A